jgi:hypothetical protein
MAMVDRYKKSGGFVQLLQVIETLGPKKQAQFMNIINEETPLWSAAIKSKMLTFDRIISWNSDALLEVIANVSSLAFVTALKSLSAEDYNLFCNKLSQVEKRKIELQYQDLNPDASQISSCVMKVVSEARNLFVNGTLKFEKVDIDLVIPENMEAVIEQSGSVSNAGSDSQVQASSVGGSGQNDLEQLRKRYAELNQQLNLLKKENTAMKDKLDRIKKIA